MKKAELQYLLCSLATTA